MSDKKVPRPAVSAARERSGSQRRDPAYEVALGARIRAARVAAKMSQGALGVALGISFQQVQKYELGKDRVAVSTLHTIATALGVHPGSFFDESMPVPVGPVLDVKRVLKSADVLGQIRDPRVLSRFLALGKVLAMLDGGEVPKGPVGPDSDITLNEGDDLL